MPYNIFCFIPGDHSTFPVSIDETELVGNLKKEIKAENMETLAHLGFKLYQAALDESYNKMMCISELNRLSQHLDECTELNARHKLSAVFGRRPPGKEYYIIVQIPKGKSIYCGGVVLMADGGSKRSLQPQS